MSSWSLSTCKVTSGIFRGTSRSVLSGDIFFALSSDSSAFFSFLGTWKCCRKFKNKLKIKVYFRFHFRMFGFVWRRRRLLLFRFVGRSGGEHFQGFDALRIPDTLLFVVLWSDCRRVDLLFRCVGLLRLRIVYLFVVIDWVGSLLLPVRRPNRRNPTVGKHRRYNSVVVVVVLFFVRRWVFGLFLVASATNTATPKQTIIAHTKTDFRRQFVWRRPIELAYFRRFWAFLQ